MKKFQKVIGGIQKVESRPTMGDFESILDESASDINEVSRREANAKTPPQASIPNKEELKIKTQKSLNKMSMMATSTKPLQEREDKPAIVVKKTIASGIIPIKDTKLESNAIAGADIQHLKSFSKQGKGEEGEAIVFWCEKKPAGQTNISSLSQDRFKEMTF